jgi:hypothetical protein
LGHFQKVTDDRAEEFFSRLYQNTDEGQGGHLEVRGLASSRGDRPSVARWFPLVNGEASIRSAVKYAHQINADGYDAFFGVNPRINRGQEDKDCLCGVCLWVDVDGLPDLATAEARLEEVLVYPLPADAAVFSGGGIHVYWILKEPKDPAEDDFPIYLRSLRALARQFDGDQKVCNFSRVLRFPGCFSHKRKCETLLWLRGDDG